MEIRCRCATPACPGVVILRAIREHGAEGACAECGETWTLLGGQLLRAGWWSREKAGSTSGEVPAV